MGVVTCICMVAAAQNAGVDRLSAYQELRDQNLMVGLSLQSPPQATGNFSAKAAPVGPTYFGRAPRGPGYEGIGRFRGVEPLLNEDRRYIHSLARRPGDIVPVEHYRIPGRNDIDAAPDLRPADTTLKGTDTAGRPYSFQVDAADNVRLPLEKIRDPGYGPATESVNLAWFARNSSINQGNFHRASDLERHLSARLYERPRVSSLIDLGLRDYQGVVRSERRGGSIFDLVKPLPVKATESMAAAVQ